MTTKEISLQGNFAFGLTNDLADPTTVSPKSIYDAEGEDATYKYVPLYIYFKNQNGIWEATAEPLVYIYIGVKGDANLDTDVTQRCRFCISLAPISVLAANSSDAITGDSRECRSASSGT